MDTAHLKDGAPSGPSAPAAVIRDVIVQFGETTALNNVSFDLERGKVTAIVGANGSGKSTVLKVLAGTLHPTDGRITGPHDGRVTSVPTALSEGITLVPQEPTVAGHLTVWQNIMLGRSDASTAAVLRNHRARDLAGEAIDGLLPRSILDVLASTLSKSTLQLIQIAAAVAKDPELLLLDEPTAVLDEDGVEALHKLIRRLIDRGRSVVIVSHRLRDVLELADNIVALAAGRAVYNGAATSQSQRKILALMSSEAKPRIATERPAPTDVVLEAVNIRGLRGLSIDSLSVQSGEIVGIAGQSGSGRSRLASILAGAYPADGHVKVNDSEVRLGSVTSAKAHGVAYVPEDRQGCGIMANQSAAQNMILGRLDADLHRGPFRKRRAERANALRLMKQFDVRPAEPDRLGALFSGGNQQKVVIARALSWGPKVLIADEPTQGVDREARQIWYAGSDPIAGTHAPYPSTTTRIVTYKPTAVEQGKRLRLYVRGIGDDPACLKGEFSAESDTVALGVAPTPTTAPSIVGDLKVGSPLQANPGVWSPAATAATYIWRWGPGPDQGTWRGEGPTYTPTADDLGHRLQLSVEVSSAGHQPGYREVSPAAAVMLGDAPAATTAPAVSGEPVVGQTLTATDGVWSPAASGVGHQWLRSGAEIDGATGSTYRPTAADIGALLSVRVTARRAGHADGTAIATAGAVVKAPEDGGSTGPGPGGLAPAPTWRGKKARLKGRDRVGKRLRVALAPKQLRSRASAPDAVIGYQWLRNGKVVTRSTARTHRIRRADRRARLTLRVTITRPGHHPLVITTTAVKVRNRGAKIR